MTLLRLNPESMARSRFALSPLAETVAAMITLARADNPALEPWARPHRPQFRQLLAADPFRQGFVSLATSTKWLPAPVTIPPQHGMKTTITDELSRVRSVSDAQVIDELHQAHQRSWKPHTLDWIGGQHLADRIADLVHTIWTDYVEPDWPSRRTVLERDVMYRAGLLAAYGWPAAVDRMTRYSTWIAADAIQFSLQSDADRHVGDGGLQFVPVTRSSGTWLAEWPPEDFAVVYPARGIADRLTPRNEQALDRLMGSGRARILRELDQPATTTDLASQLGAALGTIGAHLAILRNAQLISGTRIGHRVYYRRTRLGDELIATD